MPFKLSGASPDDIIIELDIINGLLNTARRDAQEYSNTGNNELMLIAATSVSYLEQVCIELGERLVNQAAPDENEAAQGEN